MWVFTSSKTVGKGITINNLLRLRQILICQSVHELSSRVFVWFSFYVLHFYLYVNFMKCFTRPLWVVCFPSETKCKRITTSESNILYIHFSPFFLQALTSFFKSYPINLNLPPKSYLHPFLSLLSLSHPLSFSPPPPPLSLFPLLCLSSFPLPLPPLFSLPVHRTLHNKHLLQAFTSHYNTIFYFIHLFQKMPFTISIAKAQNSTMPTFNKYVPLVSISNHIYMYTLTTDIT